MKFKFWCQRENRLEAERAVEREKQAGQDIDSAELELISKRSLAEAVADELTRHLRANHFGDLVFQKKGR